MNESKLLKVDLNSRADTNEAVIYYQQKGAQGPTKGVYVLPIDLVLDMLWRDVDDIIKEGGDE